MRTSVKLEMYCKVNARKFLGYYSKYLKIIMPRLATSEIKMIQLVLVAEHACLKLALSETLKTGFLV